WAARCVHEASHAVMMVCTGKRIGSIEVAMNFERGQSGVVVALVRGNVCYAGVTGRSEALSPVGVPVRRPNDAPIYCWRAFLKSALVTAAGPAGEMKYRAQAGLTRGRVGG